MRATCTQGFGKDGQLGTNDNPVHSPTPRLVSGLEGRKVVQLALGGGHSGAVDGACLARSPLVHALNVPCTGTGNVFMWGRGRDGQLAQ
jgi:hypothetical protein